MVDIPQVAPQRAEQVEAQGVGAVGARALGGFVYFDEHRVASGGDSKTTGQPKPRIIARLRISTTRLL